MVMCFLILFCVVGAFFPTNARIFNELADKLLAEIKNIISTKKLNYFSLPSFSKKNHDNVKPSDKDINLSCENGSVGPIYAMERAGNAEIKNFGKAAYKFDFQISPMNLDFKNCNVKAVLKNLNSDIEGRIGPTSASVEVSLKDSLGKCNVSFDQINVNEMGPITMNTGKGMFVKVTRNLLGWVINLLNPVVKYVMNMKMSGLFKEAVPKADLCKYVPSWLVG